MAAFVLIHGAFHTGACFDPVTPLLEARGHAVSAPTLPGMGGDAEALRAATLDGWARFTLDHCNRLRETTGGPVVLAGHSRGGLVLSAAAELDPSAVDRLAYICAMMLPVGMNRAPVPSMEPLGDDDDPMFRAVEGGAGIAIDAQRALPAFAQLCPPELREKALAGLVSEPLGPLSSPLAISEARWGSVARSYIECTQDRTIPIDQQRAMQAGSPGTARITLDADHSPFLCRPDALAEALCSLV